MPSPVDLEDERIKGTHRHVISARNRSDRPVRITDLALYDCVNVQERCVAERSNLLLVAGEKRVLIVVRPWMPGRRPRYEVAYRWRPE